MGVSVQRVSKMCSSWLCILSHYFLCWCSELCLPMGFILPNHLWLIFYSMKYVAFVEWNMWKRKVAFDYMDVLEITPAWVWHKGNLLPVSRVQRVALACMETPYLSVPSQPLLLMKALNHSCSVLNDARSKISSQQGKWAFKWGKENWLTEQHLVSRAVFCPGSRRSPGHQWKADLHILFPPPLSEK